MTVGILCGNLVICNAYCPALNPGLPSPVPSQESAKKTGRKRSSRKSSQSAKRKERVVPEHEIEVEAKKLSRGNSTAISPSSKDLILNEGTETLRQGFDTLLEDYYAQSDEQIEERKLQSLNGSNSTSRGWSEGGIDATELIFRFDRHGEGWGEEIFPHLTVEQRPIFVKAPPKRNRGNRPDPWEDGSPELFLRDHCGIPEDKIDTVMTTATAWRFTAGGRPLIDRRRRSRAARNLSLVTEYLEKLGVEPGLEGVGKIFMLAPKIMLCKPLPHQDRWDKRAVQLAYYYHIHGDCNVSEEDPAWRNLGVWVKKQRAAWQQGALLEDRMQILSALGFEVGFEAQITADWEERFDQLLEWLLIMKSTDGIPRGREWLCLQWGIWGGAQGRRCCIWVQLQRQLRARGFLPMDAIRRLDSLNFPWKPLGSSTAEIEWLEWVGKLAFTIEREKKIKNLAEITVDGVISFNNNDQVKSDNEEEIEEVEEHVWENLDDVKWQLGKTVYCAQKHAWIHKELQSSTEAIKCANMEPGLKFWLARQLHNWRHRAKLSPEQGLVLRLMGLDFSNYHGMGEWRSQAHKAAKFLMDSRITTTTEIGQNGLETVSGKKIRANLKSHSERMKIARWVLTQQALLQEGQLSKAQLRYLVLLDLLWIVNYKELARLQARWLDRLQIARLDVREGREKPSEATMTWIRQQSALATLGWLEKNRVQALNAIGVPTVPQRSTQEIFWDARISEMLAYRRLYGTCRLPEGGWSKAPKLASWLRQQQILWSRQKLTQAQINQLSALGIKKEAPWEIYDAEQFSHHVQLY